jgi:hypothetical protein
LWDLKIKERKLKHREERVFSMKMDCGVSAGEAPNSMFPRKVLPKQISLPKTAWILIYQPWSCW